MAQQRRITAQIMRSLEEIRQAANHMPSTRSEKLRKRHHTQRILAKDDTNSILSNDNPDNEDLEGDPDPEKQSHLKWSPALTRMPLFTSAGNYHGAMHDAMGNYASMISPALEQRC